MTVIDATAIPCPSPRVMAKQIDGEFLLYRDKDQPGVTLNGTAGAIWQLCDGRHDVAAIARELGTRFECPPDRLLPDIEATIQRLAGLQMLSISTGAPPRDGSGTATSTPGIEWSRIAAPQTDHHDVEQALRLLGSRTSGDDWPHRRPHAEGCATIADGRVAIRHCYPKTQEHLVDAQTDHPNIALAMEYLRRWPLGYRHFAAMMHTVHPVVDPAQEVDGRVLLRSSYCHSAEGMWGTMWSTINCPVMLAENAVHEMAHQKLFALGVYKERCLSLVTNAPDEMYVSPVITDRRRPMSAVLHGVYAFA